MLLVISHRYGLNVTYFYDRVWITGSSPSFDSSITQFNQTD